MCRVQLSRLANRTRPVQRLSNRTRLVQRPYNITKGIMDIMDRALSSINLCRAPLPLLTGRTSRTSRTWSRIGFLAWFR